MLTAPRPVKPSHESTLVNERSPITVRKGLRLTDVIEELSIESEVKVVTDGIEMDSMEELWVREVVVKCGG